MSILFPLWFALALGIATPDVPAQNAGEQRVVRTVRKSADGKIETEQHAVDPNAISTTRVVTPRGQTFETSFLSEQRVLIELRARPLRDRVEPGLSADLARQRDQLRSDLLAIDQRLDSSTQSQITREFDTLFSGVAASVSAAAVEEIRHLPYVASVHPDVRVHASLAESVPLIGATSVWSTYGVNGSGVKVAVIDTGIDYKHADLGSCLGAGCKVAGGYDFVNDDADPRDDNGHGTHVAGIVAANGAVKGVAPGATLLAYKVLDAQGYGDASDIIAAIERAVLDGAKIANLSLGGYGSPGDPMTQAVDNATAAGMLSVIAAGNRGYGDYQTIDSPGLALTALTVGSSTKSGQMSYFSSRGYVMVGDELVMKPEVVAPGEAIRSTVPTTGTYGNASGYAQLSGTSMATPHVAGAAALMLQWKPGLSASEIKSRLAGTAQPLGENIFYEGGGRIDLVNAFGATVVAASTHVPLGVASGTSGTVTLEKSVTIRNTAATARTVTLSEISPSTLPQGTTLQITPSSATLQAGQSAVVTLRATIDTAVTGAPEDPLNWTTRLRVTDGSRTLSVPVYFFRGSMLTLNFEGSPEMLLLAHPVAQWSAWASPIASSYRSLVPSGAIDLMVEFHDDAALTLVVREQQDVANDRSLTISKKEATRTLTLKNVDDAGNPLPENRPHTEFAIGLRGLQHPDGVTISATIGTYIRTIRVSPLSPRYALAAVNMSSFSARHFISSWLGAGLSADITLPQSGVPWRTITRGALRPAGAVEAGIAVSPVIAEAYAGGGGQSGYSPSVTRGELSSTLLLQTPPRPSGDFPFLVSTAVNLYGYTGNIGSATDVLAGGMLLHEGTAELKLDRYGFFDLFDATAKPLAVLAANVTRWDLDLRPNYLPAQFFNWNDRINASNATWITQTLSTIETVAGKQPEFTLYRNGTVVGTYPMSELMWGGLSSPAGPHEIRSTSTYPLGGITGASHFTASFDNSGIGTDTNPPSFSNFRIERDGQQGGTSAAPGGVPQAAVKFSVTDDYPATVTLEWRQNGTTNWTPLALTVDGNNYSALVPLESTLDLRVTATDARGNRFQEDWIPAAAAQSSLPPTAPSFVKATRSGNAAVTVTWRPALSYVGIAEYRIERMPGGLIATTSTLETSFVDTNVQAGNAYTYRVIAVDKNGGASEPSAYDLVTLVTFQDDPVVARTTRIRRMHITELVTAVNAVRKTAGLSPYTWSGSYPLVVGASELQLLHALVQAREALHLARLPFRWITQRTNPVLASDIQDLRDAVR